MIDCRRAQTKLGKLAPKAANSPNWPQVAAERCACCRERARWLKAAASSPSPTNLLGLQHNPLANFSVGNSSTSEEYEPFKMSIEINPTTASSFGQASSSSCRSTSLSSASTEETLAATTGRAPPASGANGELELAPGGEPQEGSKEVLRQLVLCFSLKKNLQSIGKLTPSSSDEAPNGSQDIKVIHGLRTLAMVWIIFGHSIGLVSPEMLGKLGFCLSSLKLVSLRTSLFKSAQVAAC